MKTISIAIIMSITGVCHQAIAQKQKNKVYQTLINADSVIMISHEEPEIFRDERPANTPYLLHGGKPNNNIVKQKYILNRKETETLASILIIPNKNGATIERGKCFMPHHAVMIFSKNRWSYIDICFTCKGIQSSDDIGLETDKQNSTWITLQNFFARRKLTYRLYQ